MFYDSAIGTKFHPVIVTSQPVETLQSGFLRQQFSATALDVSLV